MDGVNKPLKSASYLLRLTPEEKKELEQKVRRAAAKGHTRLTLAQALRMGAHKALDEILAGPIKPEDITADAPHDRRRDRPRTTSRPKPATIPEDPDTVHDPHNVRERLWKAVAALAGRAKPIQARLEAAGLELAPLRSDEFADPTARAAFTALKKRLTARGGEEEAERAAQAIVDLDAMYRPV